MSRADTNYDSDDRDMTRFAELGSLEQIVMDHLWRADASLTVREVFERAAGAGASRTRRL